MAIISINSYPRNSILFPSNLRNFLTIETYDLVESGPKNSRGLNILEKATCN